MPTTLNNITIPRNQWVNLYTLSGVPVGTQLSVENTGNIDIYLSVQATQPSIGSDNYNVLIRRNGVRLQNNKGDLGAWAYCQGAEGKININPNVSTGFAIETINVSNGIGSGVNLDAWGIQKVVNDYSLFHGLFTFDIPPSMWLIQEDGSEISNDLSTRITSINGRMNITSGAGSAELISRRHPRYQPDRGLKYAASLGFKGANNNGILKAGLFVDAENGTYFKTKGDGKLYACVLNNTVETHEEEITFPFDIDITLGNIYDIQMQWRGVGNIKFYAGNPASGLLELVHEIKFLNTLDEALSISNPALAISFYADNVTESVNMWCGCVDATSEGGAIVREQYGEYTGSKVVSSGDGIVALKSPDLINGKINTRDIRLARIFVSSDKKASVNAYLTRDPLAITGGTFATFKSGSFIEANDTMTSINTALMSLFATFLIPAGGTLSRNNPARESIDFFITRGDYLVLVCESGAIAEIETTIEYGEEI